MDVCEDCGVERPRWHGGSHYRYCNVHRCYGHRVCCATTADEDWQARMYHYVPRQSIC